MIAGLDALATILGFLVSGALGARESKDGNCQRKYTDDQGSQQKCNSKRIHIQLLFFASNMLKDHDASVRNVPTTITNQFGLSTLPINGEITMTARNTLPALSNMFDNRLNWLGVKTGSFQI